MGVLGGIIGEGAVRYWPPTNSFLLIGVLTSVPILVKIDREMRPWECSQTDRHTHTHTDTHTDTNRFYNLSHAICYSYGTDNDDDIVTVWTVAWLRKNAAKQRQSGSELQVDGPVIKYQLCGVVCVCSDTAGGVDILCNALHTKPGGLSRLSRCQPADILYCHSSDAWHRC